MSAAPEPSKAAAATATTAVPRSALELRAARRRVLQRRFGLWVGAPTLLAIVYYLAFATAQYDARLVLAVESNEGRASGEVAGKGASAGNQRDARLLREALRAQPALAALDHGRAFREHYAGGGNWFTALAGDAGADATFDYFRDKVAATHEPGTNLVTVRVRAFSGDAAHDFAARLVEHARAWIAEQNAASSAARLELAQAEVARARARLAEVTAAAAPPPIDLQIAEKRVEIALGGLQEAQLEVGRAQRYLVVLDGPSRPDTAALPRRAWGIATVFFSALVLVAVLSLLGAAVREHAKF